jgi:tetratricopeptide (TPR) repeat protein
MQVSFERLIEEAEKLSDKADRGAGEPVRLLGRAAELYRQALALRPGDFDCLYNLGHCLVEQSRLVRAEGDAIRLLRDAISAFESALQQMPWQPQTLWNLVCANSSLGLCSSSSAIFFFGPLK